MQSFDKGIGSMFLHLLCDLEGADAQYFCFLTCQLYKYGAALLKVGFVGAT